MTAILIGTYSSGLNGWPRVVTLGIGSLLLFSLTIEVVKKRYHMNVISSILKDLQSKLLQHEDLQFPLGEDIKTYIEKKANFKTAFSGDYDHPVFEFFRGSYARQFLTWVMLSAAISMAILTELEFFLFIVHYIGKEMAFGLAITVGIIAIIAPTVIYFVVRREDKDNKLKKMT